MKNMLTMALLGSAIGAPAALAQTVGVNAVVQNDVKMTTQANATLHQAVVRERVSLGNDILTGRASRLQVLLLDKSNFTVGPNAKIRVDRFVYDPNRKASSVGLGVAKGAFRFMSGKPTHANPGQSGIRTPTASIGIRGTIVEGIVGPDAVRIARAHGLDTSRADPETATLVLLRGPGSGAVGESVGSILVEGGGREVVVTGSGYAVFVPAPGEAPTSPFLISNQASSYLASLLGTGGAGFAGPGTGGLALIAPASPLDGFFFDEICALPKPGSGSVPGVDPVNPSPPAGGPAAGGGGRC